MSRTGNLRTKPPKKHARVAAGKKGAPEKGVKAKEDQKKTASAKAGTVGKRAASSVTQIAAPSKRSGTVAKKTEASEQEVKTTAKAPKIEEASTHTQIDTLTKALGPGTTWALGVQRRVLSQIAHPDITMVLDTETTGLPLNGEAPLNEQPTVIEFAARKYEGGRLVDEIEFLINPGFPLPKGDPNNSKVPNIPKITGITDDMLKDQPKFIGYLPILKEWFFGVRRAVGHNPWFDMQLLAFDLERVGASRAFPYPPEVIDTIQMSMYIKGFRMNLFDLHEHFFKERFPAHRAMPDVIACARCYHHMLDNRK